VDLSGPTDDQVLGWSRRLKSYQERVNTGDVDQAGRLIDSAAEGTPTSATLHLEELPAA
jgi:RNA polymerase-interacting CarD/CdnL/TRCF family regulator